MQASLLVRHPDTGKYYVNFDPYIPTLIRETDQMRRMNLDVPLAAIKILQREASLKEYKSRLDVRMILNFINILPIKKTLSLKVTIILYSTFLNHLKLI